MIRAIHRTVFGLVLLTRLDVKQQLSSVWFYLILVGNLALPPSWFASYPDKESFKVLLVDELRNANVENIRTAIEGEGFPVVDAPDFDVAMRELVEWRTTAVVRVDPDGRVQWYASTPRLRKLFARAIRASMLRELNGRLDDMAARRGEVRYELPLVARNYFVGIDRREVSMATFMVRTTWYFAGLVTLTTFILMRSYLGKLKRIYSSTMIVTAKLVSGTILGSSMMVLFLGWTFVQGFTFPDLSSYLLDYVVVLTNGVAFGCALGAIPLAISRDLLGLVFGALMAISLSFMGFGQLSAFLTPISNMHPLVHDLDFFNPLYNSNQFIHNCTYLGDSMLAPKNVEYLARIAAETLLLVLAGRIALGRA
jgi:hypothetical protein